MTGDPGVPAEQAYAWIAESSLAVAACFTLVQGVEEEQVLAAFAAGPGVGVHRGAAGPLGEASDPFAELAVRESSDLAAQDRDRLWVLDLGTWLLVVEDNGFAGTDPGVAARLAAPRHLAAFWNVNAMTRLLVAESGRVLANDEPTARATSPLVASLRSGLQLDPLVPGCLPWPRALLVLLDRATGVRLTRSRLEGPATLVTLPDGPAAAVARTRIDRQPAPEPVEPPANRPRASERRAPRPGVSGPDPGG